VRITWFLLTIVFCVSSVIFAAGQDAYQKARSAMQAAIEKQKKSVSRQVEQAKPQANPPEPQSWFTHAWPVEPLADTTQALPVAPIEEPQCAQMRAEQLQSLLQQASREHSVKEDLLRAVMEKESGYRPCAVSPKGALGLMQLMPATAEELGVRDPFDPKENLNAGARHLRRLLDHYKGDVALALGAYNAGAARVDSAKGVPAIPETKNYVTEILSKLPLY
jgi:soluble lytic murein transglycosylase-like protein